MVGDFILVEPDGEQHCFSCQDPEDIQQKAELLVLSLRFKQTNIAGKPAILPRREEAGYL